VFAAWIALTVPRYLKEVRTLRAQQGGPAMCREFKSATTLLGWPLYHIRYGTPAVDAPPVRGWVAMGDHAIGILFASGHTAFAAVSVGIVAGGGLSVGGIAVGVVPMAAVALGLMPLGGAAFGLFSIGGFSAGWTGAIGGLAIAREYAAGGWAIAAHANDPVVREWLAGWLPPWLFPLELGLIAVLAIVPSLLYASRQRRHLKPR
jgi:hypothetical protein